MIARVVGLALLVAMTPGCATVLASALGATGSSARAAADLDAAMLNAAVQSMTSSGRSRRATAAAARRTAADEESFGGEPSFVCEIPGDSPQRLAASSLEGATVTCEAMNALPPGGACTCREAELGGGLGTPSIE